MKGNIIASIDIIHDYNESAILLYYSMNGNIIKSLDIIHDDREDLIVLLHVMEWECNFIVLSYERKQYKFVGYNHFP